MTSLAVITRLATAFCNRIFSIEITVDRRFITKFSVMITIGLVEVLKMAEGAS